MPLTEQQTLFVTRYIVAAPTDQKSAAHSDASTPQDASAVDKDAAEAALSEAQKAWQKALVATLPSVVALAKKMRSDPDPIGAEIADFIRDCALRLKEPVSTLGDVVKMESYLANDEDIDILEEDNPYGKITIKKPLLDALVPLKDAMSAQ